MAQPALDAVWLTGRRRYRTYSPILRILLRHIHSLIKSGCLNMQPLRLAAPFLSLQGVNFRDLRCRNFSMFQDIALLRRGAARARDHGPTVTVSSRRINRRSGPSFPLVFLRIEWDVTKQSREGEKRVPFSSSDPSLPSFFASDYLALSAFPLGEPLLSSLAVSRSQQRRRLISDGGLLPSSAATLPLPPRSSSLPPLRRGSQLFLYLLV